MSSVEQPVIGTRGSEAKRAHQRDAQVRSASGVFGASGVSGWTTGLPRVTAVFSAEAALPERARAIEPIDERRGLCDAAQPTNFTRAGAGDQLVGSVQLRLLAPQRRRATC